MKLTDDNILDAKYDLKELDKLIQDLDNLHNRFENMDIQQRFSKIHGINSGLSLLIGRSAEEIEDNLGSIIETSIEYYSELEEAIDQYEADKLDSERDDINTKYLSATDDD